MGISFTGNTELIDSVETDMDAYTDALVAVNVVSVDDTDFAKVSGVLDILRTIPAGYTANVDDPPLDLTFGLYQGERLNVPAVATYRRALDKLLAPRLFLHLENKIRDSLGDQNALYDYLRVYLMLGNGGETDDALIKSVMARDWEGLYPGDDNATLRGNLQAHLATLLEEPGYAFDLDAGLVQRARQALTSIPLEGEADERIKGSPQAAALPTWRVIDHIGPQGDRVIIRRSADTPLTAGVPGLYTYRGFHDVFLPALDSIANRAASQSWVLSGSSTAAAQTWPGPPDATPGAGIEFTPLIDGQPNRLSYQGPWGWFHMIDAAEVQPGETSDTLKAIISAGNRSATYDVRADGVTNPFNMPELREFRCPTTL